jgi:hypothetical protein
MVIAALCVIFCNVLLIGAGYYRNYASIFYITNFQLIAYETKTAPGMDHPFDILAADRFQPNPPGNGRCKKQ